MLSSLIWDIFVYVVVASCSQDRGGKRRNRNLIWLIKKTDLNPDTSELSNCYKFMTKPTHVLPNSITDAPTSIHSRRNDSIASLFLLCSPCLAPGSGGSEGRGSGEEILKIEKVCVRWVCVCHAWSADKCWSYAGLVTSCLILYYWKKQRCPDWKRLGDTLRGVGCRQGRDESGLAAVAICILWWNESPCDALNSWMHE